MLLIPCPWCGPRAQVEFSYGGDAGPKRPAPDAALDAWVQFVYPRNNPAGPHDELWFHASGCRQWLRVQRDTRTHEILGSSLPAGTLRGDAS